MVFYHGSLNENTPVNRKSSHKQIKVIDPQQHKKLMVKKFVFQDKKENGISSNKGSARQRTNNLPRPQKKIQVAKKQIEYE
jgi:hypothetical protein